MASVSISHMILFIASIVVAASVVGVLTDSVSQVSGAIDERSLSISQNVNTDIEIISDSGSSAIHDDSTDTVTILVKNTGSERLTAEAQQMDVLFDGSYKTPDSVSVVSSGSTWRPGEVVEVVIPVEDSLTGDHRVKVIINKDEELFEFNT